jgi:hypothetical protein
MKQLSKAVVSRRIVVDTDVASSASTTSFPRSVACRAVLETILTVCHRVVLTPQQHEEWKKHRSRFTQSWLRSMAARGKYCVLPQEPNTGLADRIDALRDDGTNDRVEMLKDVHLLEAALETDWLVVSMDDKMYNRLNQHAPVIGLTQELAWMNPEAPDSACCKWLEKGALLKEARRLIVKAA